MGASVAMLFATSAPVFAGFTLPTISTTIFDNNVVVEANSGLNFQINNSAVGGVLQGMQTGTVGAYGTQGIAVTGMPAYSSTSNIQANDLKVVAFSGSNQQKNLSGISGVSQVMQTGAVGAGGTQSISLTTPAWLSSSFIAGNTVTAAGGSGINIQDSKSLLGSPSQAMTTGSVMLSGTQWIVSNVH